MDFVNFTCSFQFALHSLRDCGIFMSRRDGPLTSSGDAALDCSAWRSITYSNPSRRYQANPTGPPLCVSKSDPRVSILAPGNLRVPVEGSEVATAKVTGRNEQGVEWRYHWTRTLCLDTRKNDGRSLHFPACAARPTRRNFDGLLESRSYCEGFSHSSRRATCCPDILQPVTVVTSGFKLRIPQRVPVDAG